MPTTTALHFPKDEGVADLWWPYGPGVGRLTIKAAGPDLVQLLIRDSRGATTPVHIHHHTDETFYVIDGTVTVWVGDDCIIAATGDFVFAPRGVPHAWLVTSETAELFVTTTGPGLDEFFCEVGYPVDGDKPAPHEPPDPEDFARRMFAHGIELVGPPPAG